MSSSLDALAGFCLGTSTSSTRQASQLSRGKRSPHRAAKKQKDLIVAPGDVVAPAELRLLRGRGVGLDASGNLIATTVGRVKRVNKLLFVESPFTAVPELSVGDVVVGRVSRVEGSRWQIDLGSPRPAYLHLASVNLPDGAQRRRTAEDSLQIRDIFKENDVVLCEVQRASSDGAGDLLLQARSARYGKLVGGRVVKLPCSLINSGAQSIHTVSREVVVGDEEVEDEVERVLENAEDEGGAEGTRDGRTRSHIQKIKGAVADKNSKTTSSSSPPSTRRGQEVEKARIQIVLGKNGWVFAGEAPRLAGSGIHTINFSQFEPTEESRPRSRAVRKLVGLYLDAVELLAREGRIVDLRLLDQRVDEVTRSSLNNYNSAAGMIPGPHAAGGGAPSEH